MDPISVTVVRGDVVESCHRVHAAVVDDEMTDVWGDPGLVTYLRSAAKPVQALPLVRAYSDLREEEVAIAAASHAAEPEQLEAVKLLLARSWSSEDELECGPLDGSRLRHNCSGKHAGMLAVCAARGWPREGYRLPDHPIQREIATIVAAAAGLNSAEIATAVDGCGVVTFALPLERMARMFAALVRGELEGAAIVREAMVSRPELVEGAGRPATEVMKALPGAVAKGGAEGVLCVGLPDGTGLALKVEDGGSRATGPAVAHILGIATLAEMPIANSRGDEVGKISPSAFGPRL